MFFFFNLKMFFLWEKPFTFAIHTVNCTSFKHSQSMPQNPGDIFLSLSIIMIAARLLMANSHIYFIFLLTNRVNNCQDNPFEWNNWKKKNCENNRCNVQNCTSFINTVILSALCLVCVTKCWYYWASANNSTKEYNRIENRY